MTLPISVGDRTNYFVHVSGIGIVGHGGTIESCFSNTAYRLFALVADVSQVQVKQIITFEFEEDHLPCALITWLNLLISKAKSHQLIFGDFRLKRDSKLWRATVSGEYCRDPRIQIKLANLKMVSVKKIDHLWEARCVVAINQIDNPSRDHKLRG